MVTFNWLHFTDLHSGMPGQRARWPDWEDRLFQDLQKQKTGPWDAVFFTGDLTFSGSQFEELKTFLDKLWRLFAEMQGEKNVPVLLAVPGNHDLCWPDGNSSHAEMNALNQWHQHKDIAEDFWEPLRGKQYRDVIDKAFAGYVKWWHNLNSTHKVPLNHGPLPGDFSITLGKEGKKLGVVGLNTAFLQLSGDRYKGKLAVHANQFNGACSGHGPDWVKEHDACILLTHHPPQWLHPESQRVLTGEIMHDRFALHLYGHMHVAEVKSVSHAGGRSQRFWQGRSLFGLERSNQSGDRGPQRHYGYASGRLDIGTTTGTLQLFPRRAEITPHGPWHFADDGSVELLRGASAPDEFTLLKRVVPSKPPQRSSVTPPAPKVAAPHAPKLVWLIDDLLRIATYSIGGIISAKVGARPKSERVTFAPGDLTAFCHVADDATEMLIPFRRSERFESDYLAHIPYAGAQGEAFIISRAFTTGQIVLSKVDPESVEKYGPLRDKIRENLRWVLAAPICPFTYPHDIKGTISVDCCTHSLEELGLDIQAAKNIMMFIAQCAYHAFSPPPKSVV